MTALVVLLAAAVAGLAVVIWRLSGRTRMLRQWLELAAPYIVRSGAPFEEIEPFLWPVRWKVVAEGGNTNPGTFGGLGFCPCQSEYTVATNQIVINAWPNPAQVAACTANPPPPAPAEWECPEDCVQVMTHLWHGWMVVQNIQTGQLKFNCHTFAQYHCKKPNDPDRDKPPRPMHPDEPHVEG